MDDRAERVNAWLGLLLMTAVLGYAVWRSAPASTRAWVRWRLRRVVAEHRVMFRPGWRQELYNQQTEPPVELRVMVPRGVRRWYRTLWEADE